LHVAFLGFVYLGVYRGVPALLGVTNERSKWVIGAIMAVYWAFYTTFDPLGAIWTVLLNIPMAMIAYNQLTNWPNLGRWQHVSLSLFYIISALVLQEVIGHTIWEEVNSRMTLSYVFNAIMYSPLYQARYFWTYFPYSVIPPLVYMNIVDL
jgi:hypothetical protein